MLQLKDWITHIKTNYLLFLGMPKGTQKFESIKWYSIKTLTEKKVKLM